ncbi:Carbonic anhydrase-related protein 10 [Mactra antiquata]
MNVYEIFAILSWIYTFTCLVLHSVNATELWEEWWGYSGVSGPAFWGSHNQNWSLCGTGRFQSPIDIDPEKLIYDPNLTPLQFEEVMVDGILVNTGLDLTFEVNTNTNSTKFVFSGGPLSYTYKLHYIKIHFGVYDYVGSEHTIAGKQFPFEIQLIGFNTDLYKTYNEASMSTHGLAVITVLGAIGDLVSDEFDKILTAAKNVKYRGLKHGIPNFFITDLIPPSRLYITYEGSLTQPSCQETVTWILINKPLHITQHQMASLRELNRWNQNAPFTNTPLVANNFRPPQPVYRRTMRTNISPYVELTGDLLDYDIIKAWLSA